MNIDSKIQMFRIYQTFGADIPLFVLGVANSFKFGYKPKFDRNSIPTLFSQFLFNLLKFKDVEYNNVYDNVTTFPVQFENCKEKSILGPYFPSNYLLTTICVNVRDRLVCLSAISSRTA